jgi:hypothetical protein
LPQERLDPTTLAITIYAMITKIDSPGCMIPSWRGMFIAEANIGATAMALERELATYQKELPNLLVHEGKYVLIHGDSVVDVYSSYEDAVKSGYEKFGLELFLVKKVQAVEQVQYFTRNILAS